MIGAGIDGPEWITDRNMFSVVGTQDYTKVYSQSGEIFAKLGVTNLASIGYPIPSSEDTAKATAISAQIAGYQGRIPQHLSSRSGARMSGRSCWR